MCSIPATLYRLEYFIPKCNVHDFPLQNEKLQVIQISKIGINVFIYILTLFDFRNRIQIFLHQNVIYINTFIELIFLSLENKWIDRQTK